MDDAPIMGIDLGAAKMLIHWLFINASTDEFLLGIDIILVDQTLPEKFFTLNHSDFPSLSLSH